MRKNGGCETFLPGNVLINREWCFGCLMLHCIPNPHLPCWEFLANHLSFFPVDLLSAVDHPTRSSSYSPPDAFFSNVACQCTAILSTYLIIFGISVDTQISLFSSSYLSTYGSFLSIIRLLSSYLQIMRVFYLTYALKELYHLETQVLQSRNAKLYKSFYYY